MTDQPTPDDVGDDEPQLDSKRQELSLLREFYRQRPDDYLRRRMVALSIMCGRPDLVRDALEQGVSIANTKFQLSGWPIADDLEQSFLSIESQTLLYLGAETLVRQVIAHADLGYGVPPLTMARVQHDELYELIDKRIVNATDEALDELIIETIHGVREIPSEAVFEGDREGWPTTENLVDGREKLRGLLRFVAGHVTEADYKYIYNALKHGVTSRSGVTGFRIGGQDPNGPPAIDQSGEAVGCLVLSKIPGDKTTRRIDQVTVWVNPAFNYGLLYFILDVLNSIWHLGRARHLQEGDGAIFRTFHTTDVGELYRATMSQNASTGDGLPFVHLPHVTLPIGYYRWV